MKVLVIPSDPGLGTSWYRAIGPFSRLPIEMVRASGMINWEYLADIDVCFVQRPATQTEIRILELAKKYKKPILLDYDDDPTCLNEDNPVKEFWERDDKQACIKAAIKLADIIMVSTPALKEALLRLVPEADIRIVPNAQDDKLFSFEPSFHERRKLIVMRGGSSHKNDWEAYKDGILQILKDFPEYKLAVMGYHPEWLRQVPDNQIEYYEFKDLPTYYENLMQLRPEIGIVPLLDNTFNRAKSNINFQEFVLAGANVLASGLPEFEGSIPFTSNLELIQKFNIIQDLQQSAQWQMLYEDQLSKVPKLSEVNELRMDILEELATLTKKYFPRTPRLTTATDLEFHEHTLTHGHTQDTKEYREAMGVLADWFIDTLKIKNSMELGCGTGGLLVELLKRGVMAHGLELNPHAVEYFKENHPMYEGQIHLTDLTKEPLVLDTKGDLVYSIEVFEHISQSEEWWENYLKDLSTKFKYFYFTSTPYHENETWDHYWGHKNIRRTSSWIKLFEKSGWKFVSNPKVIVNWDVLFCSSDPNEKKIP